MRSIIRNPFDCGGLESACFLDLCSSPSTVTGQTVVEVVVRKLPQLKLFALDGRKVSFFRRLDEMSR